MGFSYIPCRSWRCRRPKSGWRSRNRQRRPHHGGEESDQCLSTTYNNDFTIDYLTSYHGRTGVTLSVAYVRERRQDAVKKAVLGTISSLSSSSLRRKHVVVAPDVEEIGGRSRGIGKLVEAGGGPAVNKVFSKQLYRGFDLRNFRGQGNPSER